MHVASHNSICILTPSALPPPCVLPVFQLLLGGNGPAVRLLLWQLLLCQVTASVNLVLNPGLVRLMHADSSLSAVKLLSMAPQVCVHMPFVYGALGSSVLAKYSLSPIILFGST